MSTKHTFLSLEHLKKRKENVSAYPVHYTIPSIQTFSRIGKNHSHVVLPKTASLKTKCLPPLPYDQGQIGSCTANALCGAFRIQEFPAKFDPSRLYVYYKERELEKDQSQQTISDSGANVTDGMSWSQMVGVCSETSWPYDENLVNTAPPPKCDIEATLHKIRSFVQIPVNGNLGPIKTCINGGVPVLLAIGVYDSFESAQVAKSGQVPMPKANENCLGGHETLIVGFDDATQTFLVLNSWGSGWGDHGFFHLPYLYITDPNLTFALSYISNPGNL